MAEWIKFPSLTKLAFLWLLSTFCQQYCWCRAFRLAGGVLPNEGYLEIFRKKTWSVVCGDSWSRENSHVACKTLGFSRASFDVPVNLSSSPLSVQYIQLNAHCNGNETRFKTCPEWRLSTRECQAKRLVLLHCRTNVRINNKTSGKIGIEIAEKWKPLCGYKWGMNNGRVICRQLGFPGIRNNSGVPRTRFCSCNKAFNCSGEEKYIDQCPRLITETEACSVTIVYCKPDIRLLSGNWLHKGRVAIYHDGKWGEVCDDSWNKRIANVLCKSVKYSMAVSAFSTERISRNSSHRMTWKLAVSCDGTERLLRFCKGWKSVLGHNCNKVAYVECQRQVRISRERKGVVSMAENNRSRLLCGENWTQQSADVVCRQKGFPSALRSSVTYPVNKTECTCIRVVGCKGNERSLEYCDLTTLRGTDCVYAKVICKRGVRLISNAVEGDTPIVKKSLSGRLEIYKNHEWGIVCDRTWTRDDANVSCRQLGYSSALANFSSHKIAHENRRVWMRNVSCDGDEKSLSECKYRQDNSTNSCPAQGVGVRCAVSGRQLCEVCGCRDRLVDCSNAKLHFVPWVPEDFDEADVLRLILNNNRISRIYKWNLAYPFLDELDLSNNKIVTVPPDMFTNIPKLKKLKMSHNRIARLPRGLFSNLKELRVVDLSFNAIEAITDDILRNNTELKQLMLQGNNIRQLTRDWSKPLKQLTYLDISQNKIIDVDWDFLSSFKNLSYLKASQYIPLCCYALQIRPGLTCVAAGNAFSSCEDLLKGNALRVIIWIIITMAVVGNLSAIFIRAVLKESNKVQRLLIANLGVSDLLNGVYLLIIAVADRRWRGDYFKYDEQWRSGFLCNLTGFISMLSSQVSVFSLTAISTIRFLSVSFPMRFHGVSVRTTFAILAGIWTLGLLISVAPFLDESYFEENSIGFYERNSVCLPLQLPGEKFKGWEYGLAVFGWLNVLLCLYLTSVYGVMFYNIGKPVTAVPGERTVEESALVKRLFFVVLTDLCCWFPVALLVFFSLAGHVNDPDHAIYAWFAVCVMSINSAFNPLLYTFTTPRGLTVIKQTAVKVWRCGWRSERHSADEQNIGLEPKCSGLYFENTVATNDESSKA